ncbi:unnamed protein product [Cuscuta campestris]|uniref:Uncharacterized protein n=1 Tax=Cuscuta campestris TaxID=132261 RepID=A0A484N7W2_9ASTE|nr:unnamed protein product [Cuscuta campestris]
MGLKRFGICKILASHRCLDSTIAAMGRTPHRCLAWFWKLVWLRGRLPIDGKIFPSLGGWLVKNPWFLP